MELHKTKPIYTIELSENEVKHLCVDLHRWYEYSQRDPILQEILDIELSEGECEFGLKFLIELERLKNDTTGN